jgi:surfeit locus 1 family protein
MFQRLRAAGLLWPSIMTAIALPILISLGTWQLQRKEWKEGLIAQIEARTKAAPIPLEEAQGLWSSGEDVEYLRVKVRGTFQHDKEMYFYAPDQRGPGFHVYTPLTVSGGQTVVLVNRGFVPAQKKDPAARTAGQIAGEVDIVALARKPEVKGAFTPENDVKGNQWYWRDLTGMLTSALQTLKQPYTPFFLEAEAASPPVADAPKGGVTRLSIFNRHLEYALTWYGLAITLMGVFGAFVWSRLREQKTP